ncbi:MAG TPA: hypothetical protein PLP27_11930 [Crocinitomicaceae bacterium]|nr:hypothetical protein [Crocinitomicaceae bacterium]
MKKAVIDLGTNTFNLLIADVGTNDFDTLHTDKVGVAIGLGGINKQQLTLDSQMRALNALKKFKQTCDEFDVVSITALGTSAIRDAQNSVEFLTKVKAQTGIEVDVISGEREAELIYKGISWTHSFEKPAVIMDIGGGSTEFILANNAGIDKKISLNIGISRIFQGLKTGDPLCESDIVMIENWLDNVVGNQLDEYTTTSLVGASGVFETFYEMIHLQDFTHNRKSYQFDFQKLNEVLDWLVYSTTQQRDEHEFIIPIRKLMGPITAVKIKWIFNKLHVNDVWLSPYSMKEGGLKLEND